MIRVEITETELYPVGFESTPDLSWPASIAGLRLDGSPGIVNHREWERYGVDVLILTMVWMIAARQLEVWRATVQRSILGFQLHTGVEYLLRPGGEVSNPAEGWLEREVVKAASQSDVRISSNIEYPGALIDRVVWSIIDSSQPWPAHQVIYWVGLDAKNRGLGQVRGLVGPEFVPDPTLLEDLREEQECARTLVDRLGSTHQRLHYALASGCRRGLRSRTQIVLPDSA
jgi:hypothetical protein